MLLVGAYDNMVEKEFSATPNMLSKHDAMLAIIIPTKK
jgi:hypothetical protein